MLDGPDDVLGTPSRVAAEEHARAARLHGHRVNLGHIPLSELDSDVVLDPGEGVVLSDGENHVVARKDNGVDDFGVPCLGVPFDALEFHSRQSSIFYHEPLGCVIDDNIDAFLFSIFELPRRCLEELPRSASHHLDVLTAEPPRGAAAIHGGVSDADDQYALADGIDMAEGDGLKPVDADVNVVGRFLTAG